MGGGGDPRAGGLSPLLTLSQHSGWGLEQGQNLGFPAGGREANCAAHGMKEWWSSTWLCMLMRLEHELVKPELPT